MKGCAEKATVGGTEVRRLPTAKYCCGLIYEDGETVCFSCGEPL